MIKLENLVIKINESTLLESKCLEFNNGQLSIITGESGSGKTTLLYILGMLSNQHQVNYYWDNFNVNLQSDKFVSDYRKHSIGYLFQENNLLDKLSIEENFKFYFTMSGLPYSKEKVLSLLYYVGLDIDLNLSINKLSGGEQQRLAIACVLAKEPELVICDEPTSSLDTENKEIIYSLLRKIAQDKKSIIVIATHDEYMKDKADVLYEIEDHVITLTKKETFPNNNYTPLTRTKKLSLKFYLSYIHQVLSKNIGINTALILCRSLCVAFCLIMNNIGQHFLQSNQNDIKGYLTDELIIFNASSNTTYEDIKYNQGISEEDISFMNNIDGVSHSYPLITFSGVERTKVDPHINDFYSVEATSYNEVLSILNYTSKEDLDLRIQPYYPEQKIEEQCEFLNEDISNGVYIDDKLAEVLTITDLSQPIKLTLNDIKIPVVETTYPQQGWISYDDYYDSRSFDVEVRGVLEDSINGLYNPNYANVYFIYMPIDQMLALCEDVQAYTDEIIQTNTNPNLDYFPWVPSARVVYIEDETKLQDIKVQLEDINPNFYVFNQHANIESTLIISESTNSTYNIYIIAAIIVTTLLISILFYYRTNLRKYEICLLKANGMSQKEIVKLFFIEALINSIYIALISLLCIYIALSYGIYSLLRINPFTISNISLTIIMSLGIVIIPMLVAIIKTNKMAPDKILRSPL